MAHPKKTTTTPKAASKPRLPKKAPSACKKNPSEKAKALSKKAAKNNKTIDELNTDDDGDFSDPETDELVNEGNSGALSVEPEMLGYTPEEQATCIVQAPAKQAGKWVPYGPKNPKISRPAGRDAVWQKIFKAKRVSEPPEYFQISPILLRRHKWIFWGDSAFSESWEREIAGFGRLGHVGDHSGSRGPEMSQRGSQRDGRSGGNPIYD
ncbi:hypothetical protein K438DRAFT_1775154 [Mycena galopus ATCC 62051]|nr:hypothetical protein K438DRAFT_1775154 [Mycena galopus ATCC 62051]